MKKNVRYKLFAMFVCAACALQMQAQKLVLAAGAGYKKPVTEIINSFKQEYGVQVDAIFGNLQMVSSQAKQTGEVSCIIGDKRFLEQLTSSLKFTAYTPLGRGILVLAYRKGIHLSSITEILSNKVGTLFMPQDGKAIYGIAGKETLQNLNFTTKVASKLTQVATVPQVVTYLVTGEADAGFINLTEALANKDKLGGYIIVSQKLYRPIEIVAGVVSGFEKDKNTTRFINFLKSGKAKTIERANGL